MSQPDLDYPTPPEGRSGRWRLLALLLAVLALVLLALLFLGGAFGLPPGYGSTSTATVTTTGPGSTVTVAGGALPSTVTATMVFTSLVSGPATTVTAPPVTGPPVSILVAGVGSGHGPDLGGGSTSRGVDGALVGAGLGLLGVSAVLAAATLVGRSGRPRVSRPR